MPPVSVVIIARNEAHIIGDTIESVKNFTDDIVVVDSGSTDGTQQLVRSLNATIIETGWDGFGPNKNKGIAAAKYDWILSIDSDERPDEALLNAIAHLDLNEETIVYNIKFKTYLGKKLIKYGEWGNDSHIRLFNRKQVKWNNAVVHEQLIISGNITKKTLPGYILHFTMKDLAEYAGKTTNYALLGAERLLQKGKTATWIKRNFGHRFAFLKYYFFKLGFLDGREGYWIAKMTSHYTFLKYARLHELSSKN